MNTTEQINLAQLIAQLLPLGISAYMQISAANQDAGLKPIQDIIAAADTNFNAIEQTANQEIKNIQDAEGAAS